MYIDKDNYYRIKEQLTAAGATLVAVSKTKPAEALLELYELGHRDFGENYVQELREKQALLPADIRWHFIGHLQSNKVKYIAPFVHLIHGVDSFRLLKEINKQAAKHNRSINVLLQVHIATEETKYGFEENEVSTGKLEEVLQELPHVRIRGLMGMASFSDDTGLVRAEFRKLSHLYRNLERNATLQPEILSMGMSGDYKIALEEGSNMVRIGSAIFGSR